MLAYYALVTAAFVTVFAIMMTVYASGKERQQRIEELRRRLGAPTEDEAVMSVRGRLSAFLSQAGLPWTPRLFVARSLTAGAAGVLLGAVLGHPMNAIVLGAVGLSALPLWVWSKRANRFARCDEQLPQALQLMVLALRAGHALPGALALGAREAPEPIRGELRRCVDQHGLGRPLGDVVVGLATRLPTSDTAQTFAVAVLVLEQTGGNLINVLERMIDGARARTQYRAKLRALTTQGRWSAWILCGMPFGFAVIASALDPSYVPNLMAHKWLFLLFFGFWIPGLARTVRLVGQAGSK